MDSPSSYTEVTQINKVTSNLEVFPLIIFFRLIRKRLTTNKVKLFLDKARYNPDTLSGPMFSVDVEMISLSEYYDVLGNYEIYDTKHDTVQIKYKKGTIIGTKDNISVIIENNIRKRITPKFSPLSSSSILKLRLGLIGSEFNDAVDWILSNYDMGELLWKLKIPEK